MVKTLLPTLVPDDKHLREIFIVSCAKGHRGVFEWLCEQKHVQTEEFLQDLPMCAFAALLFEHARLYNEIGELKLHRDARRQNDSCGLCPKTFPMCLLGAQGLRSGAEETQQRRNHRLLKHLVL